MQLVLNELSAADVVVIATPELTQAALEKLDADKQYTHLLLNNNTKLQVPAPAGLTFCLSCEAPGLVQFCLPAEFRTVLIEQCDPIRLCEQNSPMNLAYG